MALLHQFTQPSDFEEIWCVDFEFSVEGCGRPQPVCMVARELRSSRLIRSDQTRLRRLSEPPFRIDEMVLYVAYYASAELGCHLALGWPMPANVLDLFAEFRNATNGLPQVGSAALIGALTYFGLEAIGIEEKEEMRQLARRGGPYSGEEMLALLDYCQTDVDALARLFVPMVSRGAVSLPHGLLRGRYMAAAAQIEWNGVPVDMELLKRFRENWAAIQAELVADEPFGVYEGATFKEARFAQWLRQRGIAWPTTPTGRLELRSSTFKNMVLRYPELNELYELRETLGEMRLEKLAVGKDGRNRCLLSAFRARTGRNQPSSAQFIYGPARWLRGLIKPPPGYGIAYIDWDQQEFGIAAALSDDEDMIQAYRSGDPYLAFAKQAGAVPEDATKESHKAAREQFKACALAVQYGMGAPSLAQRIGQGVHRAKQLLEIHRETFPIFWSWSDGVVTHAHLRGNLWTRFGWRIKYPARDAEGRQPNERSIRNFPMQANGAEMLRLACILATEHSVQVCAPVHDALLITAPLELLDEHIQRTKTAMREASEAILGGFALNSDAETVRYPDRYMDERGAEMWTRVMTCLERVVAVGNVPPATPVERS